MTGNLSSKKLTQKEKLQLLMSEHQFWINLFGDSLKQSNRSLHTSLNYQGDLIQFFEWFEEHYPGVVLSDVRGDFISSYRQFLQNKNTPVLTSFASSHPVREKKLNQTTQISSQELTRPRSRTAQFFQKIVKQTARFLNRLIKPARSPSLPLNSQEFSKGKVLSEKTELLEKKTILRGEALGINSQRRHLSTLKNFFEFLGQYYSDEKLFKTNPIKSKIHFISVKDKDIEHTPVLTPEHWKSLEKSLFRTEDLLIISLLYWGGLRLEELTFLQFEYFDLKHGTIDFIRKGGSRHMLAIERYKTVFKYLEKWMTFCGRSTGPLFTNNRGKAFTKKTLYNKIMKMLKKANLPKELGPHSFRKGCATRLYLKTKDLLYVRDYLNHADAKVTQTYIDRQVLAEESRNLIDSVRSSTTKEAISHSL